jgi:hypothetical protein
MATSYPGGLDAFTNPAPSDDSENANPALDHNLQHENANDAIEAIQAELGTTPSGSFPTVRDRLEAAQRALVNPAAVSVYTLPGVALGGSIGTGLTADNDYYFPFACEDYVTFDQIAVDVSTASGAGGSTGRIALYNATASWQPTGTLIEDFGTFATDATGVKTLAPAGATRTLPGGRYVFAINLSANASLRCLTGGPASPVGTGVGTSPFADKYSVGRTYAAFPSTGTTWTTVSTSTSATKQAVFMRVTAVG